jgi:hypothetical protein
MSIKEIKFYEKEVEEIEDRIEEYEHELAGGESLYDRQEIYDFIKEEKENLKTWQKHLARARAGQSMEG